MRISAPAILVVLQASALPCPVHAADIVAGPEGLGARTTMGSNVGWLTTISGRAAVLDGRTLWFARSGEMVHLAWIEACELPQWSFDPRRYGDSTVLKPVPCGALARAWLKRSVGKSKVHCTIRARTIRGAFLGVCTVRGQDLAVEMLRVGLARAISRAPSNYVAWQNYAMSARYGTWSTYVLDMEEWRNKAVDRTLSRRPLADFNLLVERKSEISPPFQDARRNSRRSER
jgi:endonuclease YncB( thermonuclease family)